MAAMPNQKDWKQQRFTATGAALQVLTLEKAVDGVCEVTINGQPQDTADYSVDKTSITLTGVTPTVGEVILVKYQYAL